MTMTTKAAWTRAIVESGTPYGVVRIEAPRHADALVLKQQGVSDGTNRINEIAITPGQAPELALALLGSWSTEAIDFYGVLTCRDRAAIAADTLTAHQAIAHGVVGLDPFVTLLADLRHYADTMNIDFEAALFAAATEHGEHASVERDENEEGN
jgi:hypothetical protein